MRFLVLLFVLFFISLSSALAQQRSQTLKSPNGKLTLTFSLTEQGEPRYELSFANKTVIKQSALGIKLKDLPHFERGFRIADAKTRTIDETWSPVLGEEKSIRNHCNELLLTLEQPAEKRRTLNLRFRLFNDGLGFRYEFPAQPELKHFTLVDELTEFNLTGDHTAFWIPGDYDSNEYPYHTTRLSEVDAFEGKKASEIGTRSLIAPNAVQTPLMLKTADGLYINLFEAALVDYPALNLIINQSMFSLSAHLVPDAFGNKAYLQTPCKSPWRTIIVSETAAGILQSRITLNLNEPSKLKDVSWIKPMKYVGIWWEMHVGKSTWNYADVDNVKLKETDWKALRPNGRHGATTKRAKEYIDFAAKHGFDGVLIEGWNIGWEDWFGKMKEEVFDFVTPYPDFNIEEVARYAKSKGVKLIMHHETSASVSNYERRIDEAFRLMKKYDYPAVKTGYVGNILPRGEHHDGQWMVNHYVRVAEKAAEYQLMVNAHEPVRPTGLGRTYPNWLACEAARGNEFNAWSKGNPPEHETILPFTRLLGGGMDYTPGIFEIKMSHYNPNKTEQVHTTLAKQLALYVTLYSPLQMAADLPENYERYLDAFQFIKDVALDWDETKVLEAEIGDYLTIARKAKGKETWFIGGITDENARTSIITLDFLNRNLQYEATIYSDAPDAHWERNPKAYQIKTQLVRHGDTLDIQLAPGGGYAICLKPLSR